MNEEGVSAPSVKTWTASTIHGNWRRGTGILNNELYIGRLVWNRQRFVKDPDTGRRQAKPNPESARIVREVPELRIIAQDLWEAVKTRQKALHLPGRRITKRNALNERHRPRYLLSGLLTCGVCGGGYALVNQERYGCANRRNRGTCTNSRLVRRTAIEQRVLVGLKEKLMAPALVAAFIREFHAEWNRRVQESARRKDDHRLELVEVERKLAAILTAVESGVVTASTKARLLELLNQLGRRWPLLVPFESCMEPTLCWDDVVQLSQDIRSLFRHREV